jgi:hypothetical protein
MGEPLKLFGGYCRMLPKSYGKSTGKAALVTNSLYILPLA